jgi:hypothetical protein
VSCCASCSTNVGGEGGRLAKLRRTLALPRSLPRSGVMTSSVLLTDTAIRFFASFGCSTVRPDRLLSRRTRFPAETETQITSLEVLSVGQVVGGGLQVRIGVRSARGGESTRVAILLQSFCVCRRDHDRSRLAVTRRNTRRQ